MIKTSKTTVAQPCLVMPTECGRYLWDDETVTVYWFHGELLADNGSMVEPVANMDQMFRDENALQHQASPDAPWLKLNQCTDDDCHGHNH